MTDKGKEPKVPVDPADAWINELATRSRLMRELDRRDAERRRRKPPPPGTAPADRPKPVKPLTPAEAVGP